MDLLNATEMQAGYTMGTEPSGREHLVVAVKGTFAFPDKGDEPPLADTQEPLVVADSFTGEAGFSAPIHEADYAPRKPRCDVLLNGTAYAPGGDAVDRLQVGLKVGAMTKSFHVVGDRQWKASGLGISAGRPERFTTMPVTYDRAFGGTDTAHDDPARHDAFMANPIGRGFHKELAAKFVDGTPLPNCEESDRPVTAPDRVYRPMSFGPIGRGWQPRVGLAGTYDDAWLAETFPFLPPDFDDGYFQAAPPDQQIDYPKGGEQVALLNLTPEGRTAFKLPRVEVPVVYFRKGGEREERAALLDTVVLEPDARRLMLTWRSSLPLKRNMFEISQVLVGRMSKAWWRARELGKTYYPGARRHGAGQARGRGKTRRSSRHEWPAHRDPRGRYGDPASGSARRRPARRSAAPSTTSRRPASWPAAATGSSAARCPWKSPGEARPSWSRCWPARSGNASSGCPSGWRPRTCP